MMSLKGISSDEIKELNEYNLMNVQYELIQE